MLLYAHIPFCEQKCHYCSFYSSDFDKGLIGSYFEALKNQFRFEIERFGLAKKSIETLFIGGGTPSLLDEKYYEKLISFLSPYFKDDMEFSCEANPESLTKEWIKGLMDLGLNRLSIGVQSFNDEKLKFLGRIHSSQTALKAVESAKNCGIGNLSIDIMYESALDTTKSLEGELGLATSLGLTHISAYSLTIEKESNFENSPNKKIDDESQAYFVKEFLESKEYPQYEVSNFGKPCKHNLGYWEHKPYIGLGASAVGFFKNQRYFFPKDTSEYAKNPKNHKTENLTVQNIFEERLFLGLRSCVGVEICEKLKTKNEKIEILKNESMIFEKSQKIFSKNYFLADEIALYLLR